MDRRLRLLVLFAGVFLFLLSACEMDLDWGQVIESDSDDTWPQESSEPSLHVSPRFPVHDAPFQTVTVDVDGLALCGCEPEVWFGDRPVEILSHSADLGRLTTFISLTVAVPSAWDGDFPVIFRCGEKEVQGWDQVYEARPQGWFLTETTEFSIFEGVGFCPGDAVADLKGDGVVTQVTFLEDGRPVQRSFTKTPSGLRMTTESLDQLDHGRAGLSMPLVLEDMDGDGRLDLLWGDWMTVRLALQGPDGRLEMSQEIEVQCEVLRPGDPVPRAMTGDPSIWNLSIGDLDGDGLKDVLVVMDDCHPIVLLNGEHGLRSLDRGVTPVEALEGTAAALLDADGDGDLDLLLGTGYLVLGTNDDYRNRLFLNRGDGHLVGSEEVLSDIAANTWSVCLFQVAGKELVAFSHLDAAPEFFWRNGLRLEALGDLGIRKPGVLVQEPAGDRLVQVDFNCVRRLTWSEDDGRFRQILQVRVPYAWGLSLMTIRVLDLDGDGEPELLSPLGLWFWRDLAVLYPE